MGYIRHHCIVVTGLDYEYINYNAITQVHKLAQEIFPYTSNLIDGKLNGYKSFLIPPDGSNEGWEESEDGDKRRLDFISKLDEYRFKDGSSPLSWVEVQYGDDNRETKVIHYSDEPSRHVAGKL